MQVTFRSVSSIALPRAILHRQAKRAMSVSRNAITGSTPSDFSLPPDREEYHPYRLKHSEQDWINDLDLETASALAALQPAPLRFLVLYGSLRQTSYSRLLAFEMARLLEVRQPRRPIGSSC
jgi:hypothetical protein